jgi:hypothetical protein
LKMKCDRDRGLRDKAGRGLFEKGHIGSGGRGFLTEGKSSLRR